MRKSILTSIKEEELLIEEEEALIALTLEDIRLEVEKKKERKQKFVRCLSLVLVISLFLTFIALFLSFLYLSLHTDISETKSKVPDIRWDDCVGCEDLLSMSSFESIPNQVNAKKWFRTITSVPREAGTSYDYFGALWVKSMFETFGIKNVSIEKYYPLLNYPVEQSVSILFSEENIFNAQLIEGEIPEDESGTLFRTSSKPFHAFSKDGNVTGNLVYVNYGLNDDFKQLLSNGISLNGKIALMRYGKISAGLKVQTAENFGCVGVLMYADPITDSEYSSQDAEYPKGIKGPEHAIERASVLYDHMYMGDPLTPGKPALESTAEISFSNITVLPNIPSLPISYKDAKTFLNTLVNVGFRMDNWRNEDNSYHWSGPGKETIRLINNVHYNITPVWNVIANIEGIENDRQVIIGNHRDSW
jgi:hypothetical protein